MVTGESRFAMMRAFLQWMWHFFAEVAALFRALIHGSPCAEGGCECDDYDDSETFRKLSLMARDPMYPQRVLDEGLVGQALKCDRCPHPRERHGALGPRKVLPECMPNGGAVLVEMESRKSLARRAARFGSKSIAQPKVEVDDVSGGDGAKVGAGFEVLCKYDARFASDETQFEASDELRFKVGTGAVIFGLDSGVRGMCVGGVRRLRIPPQLAYGAEKVIDGRKGETLIFTITLLAAVPE